MFPGPSPLLCPGALASWRAPGLGVASWESLIGNMFALHQPQDVNTVEMCRSSSARERGSQPSRRWAFRHSSVHQVLKLTLPISVFKVFPGKVGAPRAILTREAGPVATQL